MGGRHQFEDFSSDVAHDVGSSSSSSSRGRWQSLTVCGVVVCRAQILEKYRYDSLCFNDGR